MASVSVTTSQEYLVIGKKYHTFLVDILATNLNLRDTVIKYFNEMFMFVYLRPNLEGNNKNLRGIL